MNFLFRNSLLYQLFLFGLSALLIACQKESLFKQNLSIDPDSGIAIVDLSGNYGCAIVYGDDKKNAEGLVEVMESKYGSRPQIYHLGNSARSQEVLIGNINRRESKESLSLISGVGYIIRVVNRKLVIAGTDDVWTAIALYEFRDKILNSSKYMTNETLVIPLNLLIKYETNDPQLLAFLINHNYPFSLSLDYVLTCPIDGNHTTGQGSTSDGDNFYFAIKNTQDSSAKICKYNMSSLKTTGKTAAFNGGHANDLTYNSHSDCLYLARGRSQSNYLTVISCKDLSIVEEKQIPVGAGAITYNSLIREYAVSQGGLSLHILNEKFELEQSFDREYAADYTAQGMGSDDSFIYFPMSGKRDNIIVVYDWSGNYVTTLTLETPSESESLFYASGNYYVTFASAAASLYLIKPICLFMDKRQ